MKVAAIQMRAEPGARDDNMRKAMSLAQAAAEDGARVICLPELFHSGYFPHSGSGEADYESLAEPLDGPTARSMADFAKKHDVWVLMSLFERGHPGIYYNSVVLLGPDGANKGVYRKAHIPLSATVREKDFFRPGNELKPLQIDGHPIGIQICYDRLFPEASRTLSLQGAKILFVSSGTPAIYSKEWIVIVQARAIENQVFVVGANLTGEHPAGFRFVGNSMIINPFGTILARAGDEETAIMAELDLQEVEKARRAHPLYRDRRPELYNVQQ